jgi:hypothetical protein
VRTHLDCVERERPTQSIMHLRDDLRRDQAVANIGLIRDYDGEKPGLAQFGNRLFDAGLQAEFAKRARRTRLAVAHNVSVDDPIAIDEHRTAQALSSIGSFLRNAQHRGLRAPMAAVGNLWQRNPTNQYALAQEAPHCCVHLL